MVLTNNNNNICDGLLLVYGVFNSEPGLLGSRLKGIDDDLLIFPRLFDLVVHHYI